MKRRKSPGQLVLLHLCCVCHVLVPYERALRIDPRSPGANHPLHEACIESERRWIRDDNAAQWDGHAGSSVAAAVLAGDAQAAR